VQDHQKKTRLGVIKMTNLIEQFELTHAAACQDVIQHDTKRKVWNGVEPLEVGHILTFEADCWDSVESGAPALVLALATENSGKIRAQLAVSTSEYCHWMRVEHIRPVTRKIDHSGVDGKVMSVFIPSEGSGEVIRAEYKHRGAFERLGYTFSSLAACAQILTRDEIATIPEGYRSEFHPIECDSISIIGDRMYGQVIGKKQGWE